jgi:5-carboxymethyl-2-hydroxymuconate isomerase
VPHLTLEYTANLTPAADLARLLLELHRAIAGAAGIQLENFKSRAIRRDLYAVGPGESDEGFVHLEIAVFGGRPPETRDEVGRTSLAILVCHFGSAVQITVEIREMDRAAYFKNSPLI